MFNRLSREGKNIRSGLFVVIIFAGYLVCVILGGRYKLVFQGGH